VPVLLFAILMLPILQRILRRRRGEGAIEIEAEVARLPATFAPSQMRSIPLAEIRSIHRRTRGRNPQIGIGVSSGAAVTLRRREFAESDGLERLEAALRAAIAARAGGAEQLAAIDRRSQLARILTTGVPWICVALVLVTGAAFGVTVALGGWTQEVHVHAPIRLGALVSTLVEAGDWWRIVTANFLHANSFHYAGNAFAFVVCGLALERWIGASRTLVVALASGLGGTLASLLLSHPALSLGASTMVMGLYAAWLVAIVRYREQLPHRLSLLVFGVIALSLGAGEFSLPNIDHAAHLGGGLTGAAILLLLGRDSDPLSLRAPSRVVHAALGLLVLIYAAALARGVAYAWTWDDARRLAVDERLLASGQAVTVNMGAWDAATLPSAPQAFLARADERMRTVTMPPGSEAAFLDTRAMLAWRLGDLEAAIAFERAALRADPARFHASQLARFEWAHQRARGAPLRIGDGPANPTLRVVPAEGDEPGPYVVEVQLGERPPSGLELHTIVVRGEAPLAHFAVRVGPEAGPQLRIGAEDFSFHDWGDDVRLDVVLVDATNTELTGERYRWQVWVLDPAVAELP
jgi:rhomboid protease GluP